MNIPDIRTVTVIGAGTMGSGIALTALRAGFEVRLYDISQAMLSRASEYIQHHLQRKNQEDRFAALSLIDKLEAFSGSDVVIEAAPEKLDIKKTLFRDISEICPPPALLVSNTSTLPITLLAASAEAPERVGGMHFFNPAPVLPLVEVIRAVQTSETAFQRMLGFARSLGKTPVAVNDTPGFIVNRVARPFYGEALKLLAEGAASHSDIDAIMEGIGFRMGPFRLMDLIGIDINFTAMKSMYEQTFFEPRYRPSLIQQQKIHAGHLGRKTGRGFYNYAETDDVAEPPQDSTETPAFSGKVLLLGEDWAPDLRASLQAAGMNVTGEPADDVAVAIVAASHERDLQKHVIVLDQRLSEWTPLLVQCYDKPLSEIASWMEHPQRLAGLDGLFFATSSRPTLARHAKWNHELEPLVEAFMAALQKQPVWIQETPGLVASRILCMLINEAAFAALEKVANPETIDLAMKLGVNYPKGLFEWGAALGYSRVLAILQHLYDEYGEDRYRPCVYLKQLVRMKND
ncbi:MAG: 3-hydroxyacyl-CoA dehydrogenase NAD-binding domain-containing protein [candidate division KSB1 bacterium]|nr:3-hydroxyacyl-CoA dehydrogenase NAD-binding domain-containing protein [candidate division KSB1 bacterium]